jgi:uncharacterized protein
MQEFKDHVDKACGECAHVRYCRGGCPYNAIAPTGGRVRGVDPYCKAYNRIFNEITDRLNREMSESPMMEMDPFPSRSRKGRKPGIMSIIRRGVTGRIEWP